MDIREPNDLAAAVDCEPIEVSKFWINRSGDACIIQLKQYHSKWFIDCRRYCSTKEGLFAPTSKGIMIAIRRLPDLIKAITKAETEANKRGLIAGGDE
jgi:hypothetical protein